MKKTHINDNKDAVIALHQAYVDLHVHEDNLIWNKVKNFLYINAALISGYQILLFDKKEMLLPVLGIIFNLFIMVLFLNSKKHIGYYREKWIETEKELIDCSILNGSNGNSKQTQSTLKTSVIIISFSIVALILWLYVFFMVF